MIRLAVASRLLRFGLMASVLVVCAEPAAYAADRPNIVVLITDEKTEKKFKKNLTDYSGTKLLVGEIYRGATYADGTITYQPNQPLELFVGDDRGLDDLVGSLSHRSAARSRARSS